jgi:cell fate (sporulation/competence/biofilm development) regulator YlbF (YheA/YmcA/DUF963 family)
MEELLSKAAELGRLLADHPRFGTLMAARDAVRADEPARKLMADYERQVNRIQDLTLQNRPIEVADKRRLAELEQTVASNEKIKALAKAQADFTEMMSSVNRAIYENLSGGKGPSVEA